MASGKLARQSSTRRRAPHTKSSELLTREGLEYKTEGIITTGIEKEIKLGFDSNTPFSDNFFSVVSERLKTISVSNASSVKKSESELKTIYAFGTSDDYYTLRMADDAKLKQKKPRDIYTVDNQHIVESIDIHYAQTSALPTSTPFCGIFTRKVYGVKLIESDTKRHFGVLFTECNAASKRLYQLEVEYLGIEDETKLRDINTSLAYMGESVTEYFAQEVGLRIIPTKLSKFDWLVGNNE